MRVCKDTPSWAGACICWRVGRKIANVERRQGIPQDVRFQTQGQLGLDIIDQVRGWGFWEIETDRGPEFGNIVPGVFTLVLAKCSKSFYTR